jgi:catechol 2,3-dioxygenase-like lactoylglutathione lyase family enzyme
MDPMTSGVDHVGLTVRDLDQTRRFFCDCLGCRSSGKTLPTPRSLYRTVRIGLHFGRSTIVRTVSRSTGAAISGSIIWS